MGIMGMTTDVWVYMWTGNQFAEIQLRSPTHRLVHSVKGEIDVIERNFAELLAVARLAREEEGAVYPLKAKLDAETIATLVPPWRKILERSTVP